VDKTEKTPQNKIILVRVQLTTQQNNLLHQPVSLISFQLHKEVLRQRSVELTGCYAGDLEYRQKSWRSTISNQGLN